jgi:hypothetical protein
MNTELKIFEFGQQNLLLTKFGPHRSEKDFVFFFQNVLVFFYHLSIKVGPLLIRQMTEAFVFKRKVPGFGFG